MALVSNDTLPMSFSNALERFRATVNTEDAQTFASTTMEDLYNLIERIERIKPKTRKMLGRIQQFLEEIARYSKIVDIMCNQALYLPYIWVKFVAPIYVF